MNELTQQVTDDRAREAAYAFDLARPPVDFYDNPFPYYHACRMYDPVRLMPDGSYFLTRYADLRAIYRDTKTFSSDKKVEFKPKFGDSLLYAHHTTSLVFNDPPFHTRVRRLMTGALSPKAVAAMEAPLVKLVDALLDRVEEKREVDLISDYAAAIPIEVIGNLFDMPQDERGPLREWSRAILSALEPSISPQMHDLGNNAVREFLAYLADLVARRREHPGDPEKDVLTHLIQGEEGGERLSETELLQNCIFILNAGHETTTNLIGNSLRALLEWPEQKRLLQERPDLITPAIEEFLRFESPNQLGNRITTEATVVGGVPMPAGTQLTLCIGAANHDPEQFAEPDRLDIQRSPNRHLAFGSGAHQCAGMHLARLEGQIAISHFLRRFPNYRLSEAPVHARRARFRGFQRMPATVR
ncbi:cytochrome P450 [bacterium]|nr:MAG: cytochrome P450 [bacterium]